MPITSRRVFAACALRLMMMRAAASGYVLTQDARVDAARAMLFCRRGFDEMRAATRCLPSRPQRARRLR